MNWDDENFFSEENEGSLEECIYEKKHCSKKVINICREYVTGNSMHYTDWFDTSGCTLYTFFIQNIGCDPAFVFAQVSPDKKAIVNDPFSTDIPPSETKAIVSQKYGFYTRIAFKSLDKCKKTTLNIFFQAQKL